MGFLAVGEDGLILRLGGKAREHDKPFAPGIHREKYDGSKHLNGVARTKIPGRGFALALAVGDDGVALIRTASGEWKRALTGTGRDLNAVSIAPGTDTAWAVGDEGTILRTTDGGKHWSIQSSPTSKHLHAVFASTKTSAWAVGDQGRIYETFDAGASWDRVAPSADEKHRRGVCVSSREHLLLVVGDDGAVVSRLGNGLRDAVITGKHLRAVAIDSDTSFIIAVGDDGWIGSNFAGPNLGEGWTKRLGVTSKHLRGVARETTQWAIVGDDVFMTSNDRGASWQKHGAASLRAVC